MDLIVTVQKALMKFLQENIEIICAFNEVSISFCANEETLCEMISLFLLHFHVLHNNAFILTANYSELRTTSHQNFIFLSRDKDEKNANLLSPIKRKLSEVGDVNGVTSLSIIRIKL